MYRTVLETDYIKVVDFFFDIFLKGMYYPKMPKLNMTNLAIPLRTNLLSFNLLPLVQQLYESIFNLIKCKFGKKGLDYN